MSNNNGIDLIVESYCTFCPYFEVKITKMDVTMATDSTRRVLTTIKCKNAAKCERLHERLGRGQECKENNDGTK